MRAWELVVQCYMPGMGEAAPLSADSSIASPSCQTSTGGRGPIFTVQGVGKPTGHQPIEWHSDGAK